MIRLALGTALSLTATIAAAAPINCADAAAYSRFATFNMKVMQAAAGGCGERADGCDAVLRAFVENGSLVKKGEEAALKRHMDWLKSQCPTENFDKPAN